MMKLGLLIVSTLIAATVFAAAPGEDAQTAAMHSKFCEVIKRSIPTVDLNICSSTGQIVLGGYDSEEIVYQMHKVRLYKNSSRTFYCVIEGPTLMLDFCRPWDKASR